MFFVKMVICHDLSMFFRYVWAFRTRVLKTRVPERAFCVNPFSNDIKSIYFRCLNRETFFPHLKKGSGALVGSKWWMQPPEGWSAIWAMTWTLMVLSRGDSRNVAWGMKPEHFWGRDIFPWRFVAKRSLECYRKRIPPEYVDAMTIQVGL